MRELGPRSPGRRAPGRRPLSPSFRGTGVGARAAAPPARPGQARGVSVTTSLVLCPRSLAAGRLPRSSCPPHSARLGPGPAAPRRGTQFLLPSPGHSPHGSGLGLPAGGHRRTAIVPGRVPGGRASAAGLLYPARGAAAAPPAQPPPRGLGICAAPGSLCLRGARCSPLSSTSSRVWAFTLRLKTSCEFVLICVRWSLSSWGPRFVLLPTCRLAAAAWSEGLVAPTELVHPRALGLRASSRATLSW